jgi:hypothetical protein
MIFLEKKGRFGNFLFQYFLARVLQKQYNKKIIIFSKNENNFYFNSKENIDKLIKDKLIFPKFNKPLFFLKKFCLEINDDNYKEISKNKNYLKQRNFYINGFFQDLNFLNENIEILNDIIEKKKILEKKLFLKSDLTIHIRHLEKDNPIDDSILYQDQPNIDFYKEIIDKTNPTKIKVICSNNKNDNFLQLKEIYKERVYFDGVDDIFDFFNIMYSRNIILSVSTYALWASLLSNAEKVFVPNIGLLKKILNNKNLKINSNFVYININKQV